MSLLAGGQNPISLEYQIHPLTIDTLETGMHRCTIDRLETLLLISEFTEGVIIVIIGGIFPSSHFH